MQSLLSLLFICIVYFVNYGSADSSAVHNDWTRPCFSGSCSYAFPASETSLGGALILSGPSYAISDITPASGWEILECSHLGTRKNRIEPPESSAMLYVRLICAGDASMCGHLHEGNVIDKLVRMPESCGERPFARVVESSVPADWSSADLGISKRRRHSAFREVRDLVLDADFTNFLSSSFQPISFTVLGLPTPASIKEIGTSNSSASSMLQDLLKIDKNVSMPLPPLNFGKSISIFNASLSCPVSTESGYGSAFFGIQASVNTSVTSNLALAFVVVGTLFPPRIEQFSMYSGLDADLRGVLSIEANGTGSLDSGMLKVFSTALPSFHIPGIFSIRPTFDVFLHAKADVDAEVDVDIGLDYQLDNLQLFFPAVSGTPGPTASPEDSHLRLAVVPGIESNTSVGVHLAPVLNISIVAFDDIFTSVTLEIDASSLLNIGLEADENDDMDTNQVSAFRKGTRQSRDRVGSRDDFDSVVGCIDVSGGISVHTTSQGSLFGIWNGSEELDVLDERFELYHVCFPKKGGSTTPGQHDTPTHDRLAPLTGSNPDKASFAVACPNFSGWSGILKTIINEVL